MTSGGIDHHVDVGKWKGVIGTCLVQVGEVNVNSPLPILLLHDDDIGELVGVLYLVNRPNVD